MADETTILKRDMERPKECQMGERCLTLLNSFNNKKYNENNILFTTDLSIDKTIKIIETNDKFTLKN